MLQKREFLLYFLFSASPSIESYHHLEPQACGMQQYITQKGCVLLYRKEALTSWSTVKGDGKIES